MKHSPITRQRSLWDEKESVEIHGVHTSVYQRNVHDGHLTALVAEEPHGWHLSISHRTNHHQPRPGRYPTWDEIADARYALLPTDLSVVMHLPPPDQYVALHDTTFHLHEHPERVLT